MNGFNGTKTGLFKPVWLADLLVDQTCLLIARGFGERDFLGLTARTKKRSNQRYGKTP
jgi:hypothetical protein